MYIKCEGGERARSRTPKSSSICSCDSINGVSGNSFNIRHPRPYLPPCDQLYLHQWLHRCQCCLWTFSFLSCLYHPQWHSTCSIWYIYLIFHLLISYTHTQWHNLYYSHYIWHHLFHIRLLLIYKSFMLEK